MEEKLITKNTIYDSRFFNKYVSFNFLKIAKARKEYFEQNNLDKISVCIPLSYTESINIFQILALKKAKSLSNEIPVKILIKSVEDNNGNTFREKILSKFNFNAEDFIFINEINLYREKAQEVISRLNNENLSYDIIEHLGFITKLLYYLDNQKINSYLVGQNEAYLYETILSELIDNKEIQKIYPLYIPELQLFTNIIFKEGDSKEKIKRYLLEVLLNYRSLEGFLIDILVLASYYDIHPGELPTDDDISNFLTVVSEKLSNNIFNDLSF